MLQTKSFFFANNIYLVYEKKPQLKHQSNRKLFGWKQSSVQNCDSNKKFRSGQTLNQIRIRFGSVFFGDTNNIIKGDISLYVFFFSKRTLQSIHTRKVLLCIGAPFAK